jgi:crotonobetainyl-CoA:carnitine CoA-transferase CaiB-like acyl-CoA transferase
MSLPAGPLHGVRVLDVADESGTYCGKLLADLGADVVLVEPPQGSSMRRLGPFHDDSDDPNQSLFFWHYNTSKRGVVLDLTSPEGRRRFEQLAVRADVVIETGRPSWLESAGFGCAALQALNPRLTIVSITPFGSSGPHRHHVGSDLVVQAAGGMVYVNGTPAGPPMQGAGLQAYHCGALHAAVATLLALLVREVTRIGQWVDVSLQTCAAACVEHASTTYRSEGRIVTRQETLHWTGAFRVGSCADGPILLSSLGDWTSLVEWLAADGAAGDLTDPAWADPVHRRRHCRHLFDILEDWARRHRSDELVGGAQLRRLPFAAVAPPESLPVHPQLVARRFFVPVHYPEAGYMLRHPGAPYRFSRTPWRISRPAPRLDEHTDAVFQDWVQAARPGDSFPGVGLARAAQPRVADDRQALEHGPLSRVRVLDFTWQVAGPLATRILADHGAEVIKVERCDTLDAVERRGGLGGNLNRGKRSIVIDSSTSAGLDLVRRLIAVSDVVIENFSPRVLRNWGLDDEALQRLNPGLIVAHLSGFGRSGPMEHYVSYGPTLQAMAGFTHLMQGSNGTPVGWGFSYSDAVAGVSAAVAILAALWHRGRHGEGQCIDLSQFENLITLLGPHLLALLAAKAAPVPGGNQSQEGEYSPHGIYRCADRPADGNASDRWCALAVRGDHWDRFCRVLGNPPWSGDSRFATHSDRITNRAALDAAVEAWTRRRTAEAVAAALQAEGIAASVVANAADICDRDCQLKARNGSVRVPTPEGQHVELDGLPFVLNGTPGAVRSPGPLLGEHTDVILRRVLGMTDRAIGALRTAHVVA